MPRFLSNDIKLVAFTFFKKHFHFYFLCYHNILSIGNKIINICHNGLKMYPRVSTKYISKTFNYNGWCFAQIFTFILTIETSCIHISGICESCQDWKASLVEENAITDNQKLFPPLGILLSVVNEDPNLWVMNLRTSCLPTFYLPGKNKNFQAGFWKNYRANGWLITIWAIIWNEIGLEPFAG